VLFRMAVSVCLLALRIWILFDKDVPNDYVKWAFGMIGLIVGYWLK
jgi:hypothetical protein